MKKISIILIISILLLFLSSCETEIPDNYEFEVDTDMQTEYIGSIPTTKKNQRITYKLKDNDDIEIVSFVFGTSLIKEVYHFYNSIDDYRSALSAHSDSIDGYYSEINEMILLIKSNYTISSSISYSNLYEMVTSNTKYQIME